MGMSYHVTGVRDLDGRFAEMAAIKEACDKAEVPYPEEVDEYFNGYACESLSYLKQEMEEIAIPKSQPQEPETCVYEIDISEIPKECKKIRFHISY